MFDTYVVDNRSVKEAARIAAMSQREHDKTLQRISDAEIKSKDRVDIPLRDYLKMKTDLENAEQELRYMRHLFSEMGVPVSLINSIDPKSIRFESMEDPRNLMRHYRITFSANKEV